MHYHVYRTLAMPGIILLDTWQPHTNQTLMQEHHHKTEQTFWMD